MRIADVVLAAIALALLALPMGLIALSVYLVSPGPVIFTHRRIGRNGESFLCLKFRTMEIDADKRLHDLLERDPAAREEWERDHKLRNDPRITGIGRFLRKSSLDELPQFWNVLRGDMSLVGPRPIVQAEVRRYGKRFGAYCSVRPGITGLWQISGRNDVSYQRRVAADVAYCANRSLGLYLKILALTVPRVIFAHGAH